MLVAMDGECREDDICLEGLPNDESDTIRLPDCALGEENQFGFEVKNNSSRHFRVAWPAHPTISIAPQILHLHAHSSAPLKLTFCSGTPVAHQPAEVVAAATEIKYPGDPIAWFQGKTCVARQDGLAELEKEPKVDLIKGGDKKVAVKVHAIADDNKYECDPAPIIFKPTKMLQSRSHPLTVKNVGAACLAFKTHIRFASSEEIDTSGLYTVLPSEGSIPAGGACVLTVIFAPEEVHDCRRTLCVDIPRLCTACEPLRIALDGEVVRPWCHIEVRISARGLDFPFETARESEFFGHAFCGCLPAIYIRSLSAWPLSLLLP
jgi:hydrocephalus-inducing protein